MCRYAPSLKNYWKQNEQSNPDKSKIRNKSEIRNLGRRFS
ncbi:hypothetical protein D1AOALGA4SA_10360 [Olavius algarvensis Delta 1 endosymbiont]|nr:hypothetical protein D1AOALGA4SA_10360 [Olavius algarvensis Delta 1 endosymbiont]